MTRWQWLEGRHDGIEEEPMVTHEITPPRRASGFIEAVGASFLIFIQAIAIAGLLLTIVFCAVAVLSGCTSFPEITKHQIVRANVPVPVLCKVKPVEVPEWPLEAPEIRAIVAKLPNLAPGDIWPLTKSALAEIELREGYEKKLKAANAACQ